MTMRKLADASGLSVNTLYNLIGTRDDILCELVHEAVNQLDLRLEVESPPKDPVERCKVMLDVLIGFIVEDEKISRPMLLVAYQESSPVRVRELSHMKRLIEVQHRSIKEAISNGSLESWLDPRLLAEQLYRGCEIPFLEWAHGEIDAEQLRSRALYALYLGLFAIATQRTRRRLAEELKDIEVELLNQKERVN